ncbi:uncharacterized protein FTJAE_5038 [Fusarium tjaetaba]|uniref:Uncharacterized protein n=1 Tax=Fusarium tjaetaba TaxID=1567544 RepID=A0A8H5RSS0_9HYPO|nr:uncharacterized protein FTJAE_5038 [Fusarium tjaetaba]KAF5638967.1 hypothetical protein FTJAE_5038 [Fusarium tjaetaba]
MDQPPTPSSVETDDPWPEFSDAELESYQKSIENSIISPGGQMTVENHKQTLTDLSAEYSETAVLMHLREAAQKSLKPGPSSELELQFTWGFLEHFPKPPKQPKSLPDPTEFPSMKGRKQTHSVRFAEDSDIVSDRAMTIFRSIDDLQEKFQKETPCDTTEAISPILQNLRLLNHEVICAKVLHASHKLGNWSVGLDINMLQARVGILETEKRRHQHLVSSLESRLSALEIKVMRLESMAAENLKDGNELLRKARFGSGSRIKAEVEDQLEIEPGMSIEAWISANDRCYFEKDKLERRLG